MFFAHHRAPKVLGLAAATAALSLGLLSPAHAHDELLSTSPVAGESLSQAPAEITMTFSGEIMQVDGANQVRVVNSSGTEVTEGQPEIKGSTVSQALKADGTEDETYTVTWRVVSSDGHPIQGSYNLVVGQGKTATSTAASTEAEDTTSLQDQPQGLKIALFGAGAAATLAVLITVLIKARAKK